MEIGKVPQNSGQIVANDHLGKVQVNQENNEVNSSNQVPQKDFQVNLEDSIKTKLANLLQSRDQLLQSLPEDIKKIVQQLLQQMSSTKDVAQGMDNLLKSQKNIAEQLNNLGNLLELAAALQKDEYQDVQIFINKVTEFLKGQGGVSPDQLANQLLQLAKQGTALSQSNLKQNVELLLQQLFPENVQQLTPNNTLSQGDLKQITKQLLQQIMLENMEQFDENDKAALAQLTKGLATNMPLTLLQVSEKGVPGLLEVWSVLKAVDAQQFKDISPKILQQAANTLEQLYQELKTSPDKAAVAVKLEAFLKNIPSELGKAVQQAIKQGISEQSILTLAKTFENAALLNGKMSGEVKTLVAKLAENITAKSLAAPAADLLSQVASQLSETSSTVEQLKTLMKQVNNQLFSNQGKLLEKAQLGVEQLTKAIEQNIPQALQDMATKNKLPELSRMWVLLKAVGAQQWQNTEPENLQRSASTIKELAHSLYKSMAGETQRQLDHKVLSFSVPLYFADGTSYPTHIHIYHQENNESSNPLIKRQFETWMRVSVDTKNIGLVDSVFRLYEENKLDLRVLFPDTDAINEFKQSLPDIRKSIEDTTLTLTNIMINKI